MKRLKKTIKNIALFFLLFITGITFSGCEFDVIGLLYSILLPPPPEQVDYNDMELYHSGGYILIADNGKIFYTNNTFSPPESLYVVPERTNLNDAVKTGPFPLYNINVVVGNNGTIIRSTSNDPEWVIISSPVSENLNKIYDCVFEQYLYVAGDSGTILKSTDYGLTWEIIPFPYSYNLRDISVAYCDSIIYVSGDNYTFYKTTDGGETWIPAGLNKKFPNISEGEFGYNRIYFYNDSLGFVAGPNGLILRTTDGGNRWEPKVAQGTEQINDIYFISPDSGIAVGKGGYVRFTIDAGDTWSEDTEITNYLDGREIKRIFTLSRNHGFIVGDGNLLTFVAKDSTYVDSAFTITSVKDDLEIPEDFSLNQNYPNPFNPITKISWQSPSNSWNTLKIYDVLGREITTLINEERDAGSYEIEFDASKKGLTSGIYFYQIKAGNFLQTKKMVLMK